MANKEVLIDLRAEQKCMLECVRAFETLERHYCDVDDLCGVSRKLGEAAKIRTINWLVQFLQEHRHL